MKLQQRIAPDFADSYQKKSVCFIEKKEPDPLSESTGLRMNRNVVWPILRNEPLSALRHT